MSTSCIILLNYNKTLPRAARVHSMEYSTFSTIYSNKSAKLRNKVSLGAISLYKVERKCYAIQMETKEIKWLKNACMLFLAYALFINRA